MVDFSKKKEQKAALSESEAKVAEFCDQVEQDHASGVATGTIQLMIMHGLAGALPEGRKYQQRLETVAAANGIRLTSADQL